MNILFLSLTFPGFGVVTQVGHQKDLTSIGLENMETKSMPRIKLWNFHFQTQVKAGERRKKWNRPLFLFLFDFYVCV